MSQTSVPHNPNDVVAGQPLSAGERIFDASQQAAFSFKPISNIKQALCAMHPYAVDSTRVVPAYHYCTHNISSDVHQCIVFDSNEPTARLIGVEYIVSEDVFKTLDDEEKKLWHSHKYEIESGMFSRSSFSWRPVMIEFVQESWLWLRNRVFLEVSTTYWKCQLSKTSTLPTGKPGIFGK